MAEVSRIADQLQRMFEGDAWHGPSLRALLDGVTAEQAAARPSREAHSIWEIVLHVAAWHGAVRDRLEGKPVALPTEGDWPLIVETSEVAWQQTVTHLQQSHDALQRTIKTLLDDQLDEAVSGYVGERDPATGAGVSIYVTLHGIIQHDAYHGGQIAILKKLQVST